MHLSLCLHCAWPFSQNINRSKSEMGLWLWQEVPEQPHTAKLSPLCHTQCPAHRNMSPVQGEECSRPAH